MTISKAPLAVHSAAVYPYLRSLEKKFTSIDAFDQPFFMYRRVKNGSNDHLWLPRAACPSGEQDRRIEGTPVQFNSCFQPRNSEQARVIKDSTRLLLNDRSHIIEAPTGFGKTWMAMDIIANIGVKTLVITTKEDVKTQWRDAAKKVLQLKDSEIGYIQGDTCAVAGKKLVIALIQSVHKEGRYAPDTFSTFGMLVVDEVHRMGADKFSMVAWQVPAKLRLGLSATPYRRDGKDVVFQGHIGPVRVRTAHKMLVPKVLLVSSQWTVPKRHNYRTGRMEPIHHTAGRIATLLKYMTRDENRNEVLCRCVMAAYRKERNVVLMSDSREVHLKLLHELLLDKGVNPDHLAFYVGGMTEKQRNKAKTRKIVLATYQMCSEATDVPWWDTCVLATPKADVVQIVGRIRRDWEGKPEPVVFDLRDGGSSILEGYLGKRLKWYRSINASIRSITI